MGVKTSCNISRVALPCVSALHHETHGESVGNQKATLKASGVPDCRNRITLEQRASSGGRSSKIWPAEVVFLNVIDVLVHLWQSKPRSQAAYASHHSVRTGKRKVRALIVSQKSGPAWLWSSTTSSRSTFASLRSLQCLKKGHRSGPSIRIAVHSPSSEQIAHEHHRGPLCLSRQGRAKSHV